MIRFVYFHIAGKNEVFSPVWLLPWFLMVVIVLESLVTIYATKGFLTSVDIFMYFHIAGKNEGFSPVWLLPWFLTVVIVLSLYFEVLFFNYTVFHQENLSPESSGLEQLLLCTLTKNRGGMIIDKITIRKLFHVGKLLFVMV